MEHIEFSQQIGLALIVGTITIVASAVTGGFTYFAAIRQRDAERWKRNLRRAYRDIVAFHRLEMLYTQELERISGERGRSANAWKLELRRKLREDGFGSPSDKATVQHSEIKIAELS